MATAEKALIDMLQFHRTTGAVDIVTEKVLTHHRDLDFDRLRDYLARSPHVVRKLMDSILAQTDISGKSIPQAVNVNAGTPDINNQHDKVETALSGIANEGVLEL